MELNEAYKANKDDIANLLGFFECELSKKPEKLNWGHVGTMETTRNWLIDSLSIISGISSDEIKKSLSEVDV